MGIEDAQNHAVRPQFLGKHNVASRGLKLFQAVKTIAAPESDHPIQPREYSGPHQLHNARAGSDATLEQIAIQLYAARSAVLRAIAKTTESAPTSIKICSLIFIPHRG